MENQLLVLVILRLADLLKKNNIGWCKEYSEEYNFFNYLIENPDEIMQKTDNVLSIRTQHTWARRVKDVIKTIVKD